MMVRPRPRTINTLSLLLLLLVLDRRVFGWDDLETHARRIHRSYHGIVQNYIPFIKSVSIGSSAPHNLSMLTIRTSAGSPFMLVAPYFGFFLVEVFQYIVGARLLRILGIELG